MTNKKVKTLTNDQVVRLNRQWRTAQVYHAALRSADRIIQKQKFTKRRIVKVLLQEFEALTS